MSSIDSDIDAVSRLAVLWIVIGLATAMLLQLVTAPFGRHASDSWGWTIGNTAGWVIFESVSPIALWSAFSYGWVGPVGQVNWLLMSLWTAHYVHRAFIFPFQTVDNGKSMPVMVVLSAVFFNSVNGSLNGFYLATVPLESSALRLVGLALFVLGAVMNIDHDYYLIAQRRGAAPSTYVVPQYRLFQLVSCANLSAELLEWLGFALAAYPSLPAASFAVWTFCNLVPRAMAHHRWYLAHFPDYPRERKAVIPFLL